jgi:hypothetical protein
MINLVVCVQIHTLRSLLYDMVACYIFFLNDFCSFIFLKKLVSLFVGGTNFVIIAILTLALKGAWHFRQLPSLSLQPFPL